MKFELPDIPESEQPHLVKGLLLIVEQLVEQNQRQQEEIKLLKDEINILKLQKKRPVFKPSKMDESTNSIGEQTSEDKQKNKKRPGLAKRNKNQQLTIHKQRQFEISLTKKSQTRLMFGGVKIGEQYKIYCSFSDLSLSVLRRK